MWRKCFSWILLFVCDEPVCWAHVSAEQSQSCSEWLSRSACLEAAGGRCHSQSALYLAGRERLINKLVEYHRKYILQVRVSLTYLPSSDNPEAECLSVRLGIKLVVRILRLWIVGSYLIKEVMSQASFPPKKTNHLFPWRQKSIRCKNIS